MLFVCHPKILDKHCLQFFLAVKIAPRETENNGYAKFWVDKQRAYVVVFCCMLWYFLEWSIARTVRSLWPVCSLHVIHSETDAREFNYTYRRSMNITHFKYSSTNLFKWQQNLRISKKHWAMVTSQACEKRHTLLRRQNFPRTRPTEPARRLSHSQPQKPSCSIKWKNKLAPSEA